MKYTIYADGAGSVENNTLSCAYIILSDTHFIDADYSRLWFTVNILYAEMSAVGLACKAVLENDNINLKPSDTVVIYTDSARALDFLSNIQIEGKVPYFRDFPYVREACTYFLEMTKKCNVYIYKVHAHGNTKNPNRYVDRLAKFAKKSEHVIELGC